jgi:transcriptional regulator with AAA-type ATPase domain
VGGMVVQSAPMRKVLKAISRFSRIRQPSWFSESRGRAKNGRTSPAYAGSATRGSFVTFNCSNPIESLAESQLFGHVSGTFYGCPRGFARLFPVGERRNLVPGRNRRASAAVTAQVAARGTRGLLVP